MSTNTELNTDDQEIGGLENVLQQVHAISCLQGSIKLAGANAIMCLPLMRAWIETAELENKFTDLSQL